MVLKYLRKIVLVTLCIILIPCVFGQASKEGKKRYPQFEILRDLADTSSRFRDSASKVGLDILNAELDVKGKKIDTFFVAKLSYELAHIFQKNYDYPLAVEYYQLSASCYERIGKLNEAGKSITKYLFAYAVLQELRLLLPNWGSTDSVIFKHGNKDTAIWFTANASALWKNAAGDTLFVELNAGRAQGIKENSKFDVFTTFDTFANIKRSSIQAGSGFITEIRDFTSSGFIALFADFNDTIYDNDAFEVKIFTDKQFISSQTSELGAYNIKFRNHKSDVYYTAGDGNLTISASRYDYPIKLAVLNDLKDAVDYYNGIDSTILLDKVPSGRFGGYTYAEVLRTASIFDLELFLDYVNTYPAKYINREFNFADVFATWAINNCVLGNAESRVMDSIVSLSRSALLNRAHFWGEYYKQVTDADSVYYARVTEQAGTDRMLLIEQLEKMKMLAKANGNEKSDSFFTVKLVFEYFSAKKYKTSIEHVDQIWGRLKGSQKMLLALYKGVCYSSLNQSEDAIEFLDSALAYDSTYYYARGYKGWNLIKMGRLKAAIPHCQFAYNVDSFTTWTSINLGHAMLLRGQKAEANRLYKRSFEYMAVESDFYEGLIADFDFFIDNGTNETEFRELKHRYLDYYSAQWKYKIISDSLKERGKTYRDDDNYHEAFKTYQQAQDVYMKSSNLDWSNVRILTRWQGYCQYKLKDYNTALRFYKMAAELSFSKGLGEENLASDYDDISNIYDWLNDTTNQLEYRARSSSLEVGLREKRDPKKLFMLIMGPPTMDKNDSFAMADARALSDRMKRSAELHFDGIVDETLIGKNATISNVKMALDSAIASLGENDVFMFYFSGYARNTYSEGIQLADGVFSIGDLYGYLGQVPAGRQLHIADCNGLNWREWYQRGNISLLSNEKRSLVFLGLKNARIEEGNLKHGVLSNALINAFDKGAADGMITASEWVSTAATDMMDHDQLYAIEMQTFGHDFVIGREKVMLKSKDTFAPVIELFGATSSRGENISLVSTKGASSGKITDDSKIVFAQANGMPLTIAANGRFELPKELIGVKNISIVAVDEFGNRSQRDFLISQSENTNTNESTKYAWLFASGEYQHWSDLVNPIFDAEKIAELLGANYGYTTEVIKNPSKQKITEKLDYIRRFNFKSNDQVFVFFAGHGLYDSVWGGFYVCPESNKMADDKYFDSYYPQQRIADLLDGCKSRNVFLVMDVCFGGKMFDKHDNHVYRSVNDGNEISADEYIKRQLGIPCRQFLTSGGNNYVADGVAGAHSPFASRFIHALEDGATHKDYITASEIMDYLWTMRTVGNDKKSFPRYGFFGGDKDGEYVLKVTKKIRNSATIAGI